MPGPTHAPPPGELIAAEFGLGSVREPPRYAARGELGHVWHLGTAEGEWAIKALIQPVDELTGDDLDYQLALHAAGVPLPRPVRARAGGAVVIGPDGAGYRAYEWLDLDPGRHVEVATAGRLLARTTRWRGPRTACIRGSAGRSRTAPGRSWSPGPATPASPGPSRWRAAPTPSWPPPPWSPASRRRGSSAATWTSTADNLVVGRDGRPWVIDWENSGGALPGRS